MQERRAHLLELTPEKESTDRESKVKGHRRPLRSVVEQLRQ